MTNTRRLFNVSSLQRLEIEIFFRPINAHKQANLNAFIVGVLEACKKCNQEDCGDGCVFEKTVAIVECKIRCTKPRCNKCKFMEASQ
jgi:hypothetical protein